MKKTKNIALLTLAFAMIGFASCKKDRTCTCTGTKTDVTTTTNGSVTTTSTTSAPEAYSVKLSNTTKAAAKGSAECISRTEKSSSTSVNGSITTKDETTTDITCTLK